MLNSVKKSIWRIAGIMVAFALFLGKPSVFYASPPLGRNWKLIFNDEFNGTQLDLSKWKVLEYDEARNGHWIAEDAYLDGNGHLVLRTKKDDDRYTSGAITTEGGRFEHTYGYWECRCLLPKEIGHWPAFWIFTEKIMENPIIGDPGNTGVEVDIAEFPWRGDKVNQAIHWDGYGKYHKEKVTGALVIPGLSKGFHTFGVEWTRSEYIFYIDGQESWRSSAAVSHVPQWIKLSDEIDWTEDTWAGDIRKATNLPDYFTVDYVRVYDIDENKPTPLPTPTFPIHQTLTDSLNSVECPSGLFGFGCVATHFFNSILKRILRLGGN